MFDYTASLPKIQVIEQKLGQIRRWSIHKPFFYPSCVLLHSKRVELMVKDISALALQWLPGYDAKMAMVLAAVHDHPEAYTGDHQACHKALMNEEQKRALLQEELDAIRKLANSFRGKILGYDYYELLLSAYRKNCPTSQVVKWCDLLDSTCEALHECLAGNGLPQANLWQNVIALVRFLDKYPLVAPLLGKKHPLLNINLQITMSRGGECKPHTRESIEEETNLPFYDRWKRLILSGIGQRGVEYLTCKKESFTQQELF